MYTIGIDIGASKVAAALVRNGKILRLKKIEYRSKAPASIRSAILNCAASVIGKTKIAGIGIGVPCALGAHQEILACANIPGFRPEKLASLLTKKYHTPVIIENDVKVAALAELAHGIGKKSKNFVFVALGTGIGGAIVVDGKLYKGTLGWAGEFGHTIVNAKGRMLNAKSYVDWEEISTKHFLRSKKGPADIKNFTEALAVGLLNITYALAPEIIVIGGGLSSLLNKGLGKTVVATMKRWRLSAKLPLPKITRSRFGETAGAFGAALLARGD